jgi:hypothetical protein
MNMDYDPFLRKLVNGPEAGQNVEVDGFTVNVIGDTGSGLYNAGEGIDIEGSTINVSLTAGYRGAVSGSTVGFDPSADIVNVTGASVTLQPDTAYKIYAMSQPITLNANPPAAGKWAYEGHLEIFVAGTGYIVTGSNVVLANALEPDAVNNCTVRFHDGLAIISVEDHVAGYIVNTNTGTGDGSLPYALSVSNSEYVAFDATTNGTPVDLGGATTYAGEKHVVGNGYENTILSGGIVCTSKTTFSNLSMDGVVVSSGTLTMGDVNIPNGATVAVSGGGLAVEKVTGNGGVIDLNGTHVVVSSGQIAYANGATFTSGIASNEIGGALYVLSGGRAEISSCTISGNRGQNQGGGIYANGAIVALTSVNITGNTAGNAGAGLFANQATVAISSSVVSGNISGGAATNGVDIFATSNSVLDISNSELGKCTLASGGQIVLKGSNVIGLIEARSTAVGNVGSVTISSGAILDLTGNTNATPINPGGGIIVKTGGCQVINSAGASVSIAGGTYTQINNDGTTVPPQE